MHILDYLNVLLNASSNACIVTHTGYNVHELLPVGKWCVLFYYWCSYIELLSKEIQLTHITY